MKNYTLQFSPEQLDYIFRSLALRPWGEVHELMAMIKSQVAMQDQAATLRPVVADAAVDK